MQNVGVSESIVDLASLDVAQLDQLAALTHTAAREHAPTWLPTVADAHATIAEARVRFGRVMLSARGAPIGWVAAGHSWGRVWDLHPLIIDMPHQRRGIGRSLVLEVEREATRAGALVLLLGTSDMTHATSVSDVDLYDDPLRRLAELSFRASNSVQFWQRIGFTLVGAIPDAEGPGQPSLQLAKRLSQHRDRVGNVDATLAQALDRRCWAPFATSATRSAAVSALPKQSAATC